MKKQVFLLLISILSTTAITLSQNNVKIKNHDQVKILTADIDNFWNAFDHLGRCRDSEDSISCIKKFYFDKGTDGFKDFINKYKYTPQDYLDVIHHYPKFFRSVRKNTLVVKQIKNEFNKFFIKACEYYPDYKPLKICFLISPLKVGGTSTKDFLLIGTEIIVSTKEADLSEFGDNILGKILAFDSYVREHLLFIVAHESVHDLQVHAEFDNYNLLNKSLNEGSADFIAELFTGVQINHYLYHYGNLHEQELWVRYKKALENKENTDNWMYNYDRVEEGVPADLGYYMGFRITAAYYNSHPDKKQAIHEIIEMKNPGEFLEKSGYGREWSK